MQLRERYYANGNVGIPRAPVPGEVVVIHDDNHPRTLWKVGRVTDVITGHDGQIQGAVLKVSTNGKLSTLRRPTSSLYPLEVMPKPNNHQGVISSEKDDSKNITEADDRVLPARPARAAAERAQQQLQKWMTELTDDSNM